MKGIFLVCLGLWAFCAVLAVDFTAESLALDLRRCTAPDGYVRGYHHRGRSVDIRFSAVKMRVTVDGRLVYEGPGKEVVL